MADRPRAVRIREEVERTLTPTEAEVYAEAPMTDFEREEILALARWFRTRYPTPLERLAYVRQAYIRWQRTIGLR